MNDLTLYNLHRSSMLMGDGLGFFSDDIIPTMIRIWSKGLNHFSLVQEFPAFCGPEQRRWTAEAVAGGVGPRYLSRVLEHYPGKVWWYPLKKEFHPFRQEIGMAATELFGIGYDFKGIVKNVLSRVSLNLSRLWCSEYVQAVYELAKVIEKQPYGLWPSEIPELGIYEKPILIVESEPMVWQPVTA